MRNVIVETVGRRSGRVREVPLYAFEDGDRLVVIGSNMGRDREPAWVGNLRSHPATRVRVGRDVSSGPRARSGGRRAGAAVGRRPLAATRATTTTPRWTDRPIPVVVLEPEPAATA